MSEFIRVVLGAAGAVLVGGLLAYLLLRAIRSDRQHDSDLPADDDMAATERVAAWNAANGATSTNSC